MAFTTDSANLLFAIGCNPIEFGRQDFEQALTYKNILGADALRPPAWQAMAKSELDRIRGAALDVVNGNSICTSTAASDSVRHRTHCDG